MQEPKSELKRNNKIKNDVKKIDELKDGMLENAFENMTVECRQIYFLNTLY